MEYFLGALAFIFILGSIIAIHEGGHFFFARRAGILCREYAFGMGPIIVKKKKGETLYSIRAFPIGGFCAIAGETAEEDPFKEVEYVKVDILDGKIVGFYLDVENENIVFPTYQISKYDIFDENDTGYLYMDLIVDGEVKTFEVDSKAMIYMKKQEFQIAPHNRTLNAKNKRQRALTIFGGPLMNFALALVAFFIAGLIIGTPDLESSEVADLNEQTKVWEAGLRDGDIIKSLEIESIPGSKKAVTVWNDIAVFMDKYYEDGSDGRIIVEYEREGALDKTAPFYPTYYIYNMNMTSDPSTSKVIIGNISKVSSKMADNSGLDIGDEIISINGTLITSWNQAAKIFASNAEGDVMKVVVKPKNGSSESVSVDVFPFSIDVLESQKTMDGGDIPATDLAMNISPTYKFDFGYSFVYSGKMTIQSCGLIFKTLGLLFGSSKVGVSELSGPVGIFTLLVQIVQQGWASVFYWMGLLSVNVGILNLLPIPALDGGRLVFIGYEAITKKKPSEKVQTILISVTMILLFGLMIIVSINDIIRLFK